MKFKSGFGIAKEFIEFDEKTGELMIEPNTNIVGLYELTMIITIGNEEYERTMKLEVIPPLSNQDLNKSSQLNNKNEDSIA